MREKVFQKIREDILKGRYKKGDELVECTIGKELGVSRTPVREAVRQLALEGLVQVIPNKGAFVTGISVRDVMDMYQIRPGWKACALPWLRNMLPKNSWKEWKRPLSFLITMREKEIMIRSASRTADSISFCTRLPAAGSLSIPWEIFINISRESVWRQCSTE